MINDLQDHGQQDIARKVLTVAGVGVHPDTNQPYSWPIYVDQEPDAPDNCLTLYETAGITDGKLGPTGEDTEHHGLQIQVRCEASRPYVGRKKARAVKSTLDQLASPYDLTFEGISYTIYSFNPQGSIIPLGRDMTNKNRFLWTLNYTVSLIRNTPLS